MDSPMMTNSPAVDAIGTDRARSHSWAAIGSSCNRDNSQRVLVDTYRDLHGLAPSQLAQAQNAYPQTR